MKKVLSRSQNEIVNRELTGRHPKAAMRGSSGQVMVLVTLGIVVLCGFAALAVDVGQFWSARRHMQTAADAAAIAGATALRQGNSPTAPADAVATENGFTNGSDSVTVTVNNPPLSGVYSGNSSYVEVIVSQPQSSFFLGALGFSSTGVSTRSVASSVNGPACLYALDPNASDALVVAGNSTATLSCGAIVNSSDSVALNSNGGASLTATNIGVDGGYSGTGFTPTPVTGVAPAPDPLGYLAEPTVGACNYNNVHVGTNKGTTYLNPGVYCGGIQVSGNNPVVFNSGIYILEGGLKVTATNANISGTGVMFYNSNTSYGPITLSGSNLANLSAPTSGTYQGILFFQDRSVPAGSKGSTITGSSGSTFDGAIYFPTTAITYSGSSTSDGYTIIVGDTVSIGGNSTLGDNYSSLADGDPIKSTALYE
jgi:Flp pilus assembly protein TadG